MKTVCYFGRDSQFFSDLVRLAEKDPNCKTHHLNPETSDLLQLTLDLNPHILFLDCQDHPQIAEVLRKLKLLPDFKPMLVCILCADQEELCEASYLFTVGVTLAFIKTSDTDQFIRDSFAIAFDGTIQTGKFACARHLRQTITASFPCSLTALNENKMWISTDLDFGSEVTLKIPLVPEPAPQLCTVNNSFGSSIVYHFTRTFEVPFPFPGPWDEAQEDKITPEQVQKWIEEKANEFDKRASHLIVFTKNRELRYSLLKELKSDYWLTIYDGIEDQPQLIQKSPDLIFIDLCEDMRAEDAKGIIEVLQNCERKAPVIFFNTALLTEELKDAFAYELILSYHTPLNILLFKELVKILLHKAQSKELERHYLGMNQKERVFTVDREIKIVSLTEHELWFLSEEVLPMFATFFVKAPVPFALTIIPGEAKGPKDGPLLYRTLIHGMDEEGHSKLRIIVNQLIYKPKLDILTILDNEEVLKSSPANAEAPDDMMEKEELVTQEKPTRKESGRFTLKVDHKGPSKL